MGLVGSAVGIGTYVLCQQVIFCLVFALIASLSCAIYLFTMMGKAKVFLPVAGETLCLKMSLKSFENVELGSKTHVVAREPTPAESNKNIEILGPGNQNRSVTRDLTAWESRSVPIESAIPHAKGIAPKVTQGM